MTTKTTNEKLKIYEMNLLTKKYHITDLTKLSIYAKVLADFQQLFKDELEGK